MVSHQYINSMIVPTYSPNTLYNMMNNINSPIMELSKLYNLDKFLCLLADKGIYNEVNKKFSSIVSDLLTIFIKIIPIYLRNDLRAVDLKELGINTISVEEVLSFYKKCYEFIGEFSIIPIGLNNIAERKDCDNFSKKTENIYILLNSISKYNRLNDYLIQGEKFSHLFDDTLNNIIRNSEAHVDYSFDPISQIVYFKDKQKTMNLYLTELIKESLNIYQTSVYMWEMNYCLHKQYLIKIKKETLSIDPKLLDN